MAKGSLRRVDVQARWALWLSIASALPCVVVAALLLRNWNAELQQIIYGNQAYMLAILGGTGLTLVLSFFGAALGYNSAGQRRNEKQKQSWLGFFLGALMLALGIITFAAFWLLKQSIN